MTKLIPLAFVCVLLASLGCVERTVYPPFGEVERLDPALDAIIEPGTRMEELAKGFNWSEGPVWLKADGAVAFSDVPENKVHRWKDGEGLSVYLEPSGLTGSNERSGEPGSNGLAVDANGRLVLCQHGDRRVAYMDAPVTKPESKFVTIADKYEGKRFNSPNDLAIRRNGDIYFTDPPYGLPGGYNSKLNEQGFFGVYRIAASDGKVTVLTDEATAPNGIAFSPDEKTLYLAQSDGRHPRWNAFDVKDDGTLANPRVFFDASELSKTRKGLPDGLKVDEKGNIFATGPGGVLIFSPQGKHLGTLLTGRPTGNCCFGDDGRTLYVTSDDVLVRIRLKTKGDRF